MVLFVITFLVGAVIYPAYRLNVRTYLQDYRMLAAEGAFEIKEHLAAIALFIKAVDARSPRLLLACALGSAAPLSGAETREPSAILGAEVTVPPELLAVTTDFEAAFHAEGKGTLYAAWRRTDRTPAG